MEALEQVIETAQARLDDIAHGVEAVWAVGGVCEESDGIDAVGAEQPLRTGRRTRDAMCHLLEDSAPRLDVRLHLRVIGKVAWVARLEGFIVYGDRTGASPADNVRNSIDQVQIGQLTVDAL